MCAGHNFKCKNRILVKNNTTLDLNLPLCRKTKLIRSETVAILKAVVSPHADEIFEDVFIAVGKTIMGSRVALGVDCIDVSTALDKHFA